MDNEEKPLPAEGAGKVCFSLRLTSKFHAELVSEAQEMGVPLCAFIIFALKVYLKSLKG